MPAYLEVWKPDGPELVALGDERVTIGKAPDNEIGVPGDAAMSHLHAAFERYGAGWCVRDLGSTNGTLLNGERILGERGLHHGDEIVAGKTRIVFRAETADYTRTEAAEAAPELTRREREVLLALCRPVLSGAMFTKPASIRGIAEELFVTQNAVKQHLSRLYDKFGIHEGTESRPVRLANEAIRRGAVSIADLRTTSKREE
jgi:hypothetical protein